MALSYRYRFSVVVSKGVPGRSIPVHYRTSSASVIVGVVVGNPPSLQPASASLVINPDQLARLNVTVDTHGANNVSLEWSCPTMDGIAFASVVQSLSRFNQFLVVKATTAMVPGTTYTFVLTATIGGLSSSTAVKVLVNQAPRNGYGMVYPSVGVSLTTEFEIRALDWIDDATVSGRCLWFRNFRCVVRVRDVLMSAV